MAETLLKMQDKAVEEDFWFGSVARAQGVRLLAWSKLAPKSSRHGGDGDGCSSMGVPAGTG